MSWMDLTNVETTGGSFDPLPSGSYPVQVEEATLVTTKAGTGKYIKTKLRVIGEAYANRVLFHNFNIENSNPKAVEIGKGQLKAMLEAGGRSVVLSDVAELVGTTCSVAVKIENSVTYGDQNKVTSFKKTTNAVPTNTIKPAAADLPF